MNQKGKVSCDLDKELPTELNVGDLIQPTKPKQQVVDFIVAFEALFQVTIALTHPFKKTVR